MAMDYRRLTPQEVKDMLGNTRGFKVFPLIWQRECLGILDLQGVETVLDIGCGDGRLVDFLISQGMKAEGIDSNAPEKSYLMRQAVKAVKPLRGHIQRPDNFYDLVVAHSNSSLRELTDYWHDDQINRALHGHGMKDANAQRKEGLLEAQAILLEGVRVLKPGKRFVIYPGLNELDKHPKIIDMIRGAGHRVEMQELRPEEAWDRRLPPNEASSGYRTIITKK